MTDLEQLRRFYLGTTDHGESLFETWERGDARGDSVTPSTYSAQYRRWMCDLLLGHLRARPGGMISVGSGNAAIETEIVHAGHRVLAVDVFPEAVELARRKGVDAALADVRRWSPPAGAWTVVYADGVMGHLYAPDVELLPVLTAVRSWLSPQHGVLVISNDRPRGLANVQPAPGVPGFYWLSEEFLRKQAEAAGFDELSAVTFSYLRPLSGVRERAVLTARV
ncbi:MAG: methyltransferase domain-containing protein [Micromonosporaceae bacterium]|nr:methyltransferase domain-containing protein [Micromonosporaceae bacterium]